MRISVAIPALTVKPADAGVAVPTREARDSRALFVRKTGCVVRRSTRGNVAPLRGKEPLIARERVALRMEPALLDQIDEAAARERRLPSQVMRDALAAYVQAVSGGAGQSERRP